MTSKFQTSKRIAAPRERVWTVLEDFGGHYQFNPMVKASPITNGVDRGVGAERELVFYDGTTVRQVILDMEPGRRMLIGIVESDLPLARATADIRLAELDVARCGVDVEVSYELEQRRLGRLMGWMYKPVMLNRYNVMLRGLKHFAVTGQTGTAEKNLSS